MYTAPPLCLPSTHTTWGKHYSGLFGNNSHVFIYGFAFCYVSLIYYLDLLVSELICKWYHVLYILLWLFLTLFLRFLSMFMHVSVFHLFSLLYSIPLYDCTTIYLSVPLFMEVWIVFSFGYSEWHCYKHSTNYSVSSVWAGVLSCFIWFCLTHSQCLEQGWYVVDA